jgi:hypothetical protein
MKGMKMKRYRLIKDLPYAEAGTIWFRHPQEPVLVYKDHRLHILDITPWEWFEEV